MIYPFVSKPEVLLAEEKPIPLDVKPSCIVSNMSEQSREQLSQKGERTSSDDDPAFRIDEIEKKYGQTVALKSVSFDIEEGEFFTILGPSGSGKSTLLRILDGLEAPTSGNLEIGGRDMRNVPAEKRPTSMVFQHLALFPYKNVYQNLEFGLKMKGVDRTERRQRADEMLEILDLEEYGEQSIDELSGGEQQRIAVGRSLLANPDYLLLDEPLASLDRSMKDEMQLELRSIQNDLSSTFVYVTHDQDIALTASDRVAVINGGEIVQIDEPRALYYEPKNRFVADFVGDTNLLVGEVSDRSDGRILVETEDGGMSITIETDDEPRVGKMIEYSLRPESVKLGQAAMTLSNTYTGTISDQIYHGDRTRYHVAVNDRKLLVQTTHSTTSGEFEIGESVTVGWPASAGHLVPESL